MKTLALKEVAALVQGAIAVREENGALCLERFTAVQHAHYAEHRPDLETKTYATSAMRLEFLTNATELEFEFDVIAASSRPYCTFDIAVDGALRATPSTHSLRRAHIAFGLTRDLDGNTHRVCLYLPSLWVARLTAMRTSDGAVVTPVKKSCKLLCFGDSITQGYDAHHPSLTYVNIMADELDAEVVSNGIGGEVFRTAILDPAFGFDPDVITVAFGTNDWNMRKADDMAQEIPRYYARLRECFPRANIFALTPIWRDGYRTSKPECATFEDVADMIRRAAESIGAHVVDGMPLVPHMAEFFYDQRLHPNDSGYACYARNLLRAMRPHLK